MAARMLALGPVTWREDPQRLIAQVRSFEQGFDQARGEDTEPE